ncbi:MAG: SCO family protein [Alphaproteobacteria bacterium]|nr:SCO family protein [Alphaproteobacteria bacterium]
MNSSMPRRRLVTLAGVVLLGPELAQARSFATFEHKFEQQEQFFQPMDGPAPPFKLDDPSGHAIGLTDLRGKIVVLNFIYTSCPDVCPLESERIAQIQQMIKPTALQNRVRFISVTADPVRDTFDVMKAYGALHGLDPVNWTFLTSGADHPDAAITLSQRYHNRFQKEADGSFTHGVVFHVIDAEGRWRGNFHGLDWQPANLLMFLSALVDQEHETDSPSAPSLWQQIKHLF